MEYRIFGRLLHGEDGVPAGDPVGLIGGDNVPIRQLEVRDHLFAIGEVGGLLGGQLNVRANRRVHAVQRFGQLHIMAEIEIDESLGQFLVLAAFHDVEHVIAGERAFGRIDPDVIRIGVLGGGVAVIQQHGDADFTLVEHGDGVVGARPGLDNVRSQLSQLGEDGLVVLARLKAESGGRRIVKQRAGGRGHFRHGDAVRQFRVPQVSPALDLNVAERAVVDNAEAVEGVGRAITLAHRRAGVLIDALDVGQLAGVERVEHARFSELIDEHVADDDHVIVVRGLDDLGHALRVAAGIHDEGRAGGFLKRIIDVLLEQLSVEAEGADGQRLAGEGLILGNGAERQARDHEQGNKQGDKLFHDFSPLLLANEFDFILSQHKRHRRADWEGLSLIRADDKFADCGLDVELIVAAEERADHHLAGDGVRLLLSRRAHLHVLRADAALEALARLLIRHADRRAVCCGETAALHARQFKEVFKADESGDKLGIRAVVDRAGRIHLLDEALVHDGDLVADGEALFLIMGDVDRGETQLLLNAADFHAHLHAQFRIEVGERFVKEHQIRLDDHRACQRHALTLAAAHLARIAVQTLPDRQVSASASRRAGLPPYPACAF